MSGERAARRAEDHRAFDELAVGWALHALEPEDEALFARHLPDCARCARTVAETADVMAALATDLPPADPSPHLGERLRAAVERTDQVHPLSRDESPDLGDLDDLDDLVVDPGPALPRSATGFPDHRHRNPDGPLERPVWRRLLPSALAAAVVAVILGLATWNVLLGDARNRAETTAAQQSQVLQSLLRPGRATIASLSDEGGHPVATVVAREGQVQVVTSGLAVNDASRSVYVVWGMRDDTRVALGTFDVVRAQTDLRTVGSAETGLDEFPIYAISIEPGRQTPRIPSVVVARGQVTN